MAGKKEITEEGCIIRIAIIIAAVLIISEICHTIVEIYGKH